jgi:hypothetical protein
MTDRVTVTNAEAAGIGTRSRIWRLGVFNR